MMIDSGRWPVYRTASLLGSFLVVACLAAIGCGSSDRTDTDDPGVPSSLLTGPMRQAIVWQREALEDPAAPAGADTVRAFYAIRQDLRDPRRRHAAADTLWARWEREPANLLWIEAAILRARELGDFDRLDLMLDRAAGADSTSPPARFIDGRIFLGREPGAGRHFFAAAARADELPPLQRCWLTSRLALVESLRGDNAAAVARLLDTLDAAWQAGGLPLAACWWHDLSKYSRQLDRLDDALAAAGMAVACAERDGDDIQAIRGRLGQGRVLAARGEYGEAAATYRAVEELARRGDHRRWLLDAKRLQAEVNLARGDRRAAVAQHRELRGLALAAADTQGALASGLVIANTFRYLGELDSSRVWLERAGRLDQAGTPQGFAPRIGALWLRHHLQLGDYGRADSVRAAIAASLPIPGRRQIVFDLVEQGLDAGRPDLAYRGLAEARNSPALLVREDLYDPALDLAHLAARFHARQGEFGRAHARLAEAAGRIAGGATLHGRWDHAECEGRVAELAGDLAGARAAYARALDLAVELDDPNLVHRSRIRLGEVLLGLARPDDARALFAESRGAPEYWTRFSAALMLGCAAAADRDHAAALHHFAAADSLLRPDAPRDLRARLRLEQGRALVAAGRPQEAWAVLTAVDLEPGPARSVRSTEIHRAFHRPLHRDLAEAQIGLLLDHPGLGVDGDLAVRTLAIAEQARWRVDPTGPEPTVEAIAGLAVEAGSPVVVWFVGASRVFGWVGTAAGWSVREIADRATLLERVAAVQIDMESPARTVHDDDARALVDQLLSPVLPHWRADGALQLIATGPLADLAWPALPLDDARQVVDHGAVVHLATLADLAGTTAAPVARPLLSLGVNSTAGGDRLRHAEDEARAVAAAWPGNDDLVLVGDQADWADLRSRDLARFAVLHVASHAVVSEGLPGCSTLRLAGADGDRPVTVPEARDLDLAADLVFLSCCEGARLRQDTGTGLDSFARAFLQAGAGSVVASTRQVDDAAARELALRFYRHWRDGRSRAASLRAAQLEVRAMHPEWRHPFYWAFYQLHRARRPVGPTTG